MTPAALSREVRVDLQEATLRQNSFLWQEQNMNIIAGGGAAALS
jgi:hypothetical protein